MSLRQIFVDADHSKPSRSAAAWPLRGLQSPRTVAKASQRTVTSNGESTVKGAVMFAVAVADFKASSRGALQVARTKKEFDQKKSLIFHPPPASFLIEMPGTQLQSK